MRTPELIACLGFMSFFVLLFGTLLLLRWFRYKETLAMIERGLLPASAARPRRNGKATLAWGIGVTAFGLALLGGSLPFSFLWAADGVYRGALLLPGLIVLFIGVALLIVYFAARPELAQPPAEADEGPDLPPLEAGEEGAPGE